MLVICIDDDWGTPAPNGPLPYFMQECEVIDSMTRDWTNRRGERQKVLVYRLAPPFHPKDLFVADHFVVADREPEKAAQEREYAFV
jgi:hypothetical protein